MGLYLSKNKIKNKIKELNAREAYIIESEEKLKIKTVEIEKDLKIINELNELIQLGLRKGLILQDRLSSQYIKLNQEFERQDQQLTAQIDKFKKFNDPAITFINELKSDIPEVAKKLIKLSSEC